MVNGLNQAVFEPGFYYIANTTTTTQKQSDYKVEHSSFMLIALFYIEIGRCRGRNWLIPSCTKVFGAHTFYEGGRGGGGESYLT